jgi:hypothetical protein
VAAWLGWTEARATLHESADDAYVGYDERMERLYARRPADDARHASVYHSALDAFATVLAPSAGDPAQPCATTSQWRRRKLEVVLAAWTALRHDTMPFARFPLGPPPEVPAPRDTNDEPLAAYVEPHPEAIAKLLALVRQASRGLRAVTGQNEVSPTRALLDQIDAAIAASLAAATREANDEPLTAEEKAALDALPARLAVIDAALVASRSADVSLAADVHTDIGAGRTLEETTGDLDDLYIAVREPRTGRMVLAVGASLPHYEFAQPVTSRLSDDAWRARLHAASPPERDAFTRGYVVAAK